MAQRRRKSTSNRKKPAQTADTASNSPEESTLDSDDAVETPRKSSRSAQTSQGESESRKSPRKQSQEKATPRSTQAEGRSKSKRPAKPATKRGGGKQAQDSEPFGGLALSDTTLEALAEAGYQSPTPVQAGLIPQALEGFDLMGQAQTGTGKTAAFAIPVLEQLTPRREAGRPQALVLVPTRELAVQVRDEFAKLAAGRRAAILAVYGGKPIRGQTDRLQRGVDVVVGTPGRILDHISRRTLILDRIGFVVLDEADRMLDIGFRPDIEKILRRCPTERQTLLLSATIPGPVKRLAQRYMRDPEALNFSPENVAVESIDQFYFTVDPQRKFELLVRLIRREEPAQAIIFCRTRRGTDKIAVRLGRKLDGVAAIHGDLPQRTRDRVMAQFREGKVRYLVATDVVGRGIDVTSISHIINYDVPEFCDDYVHRVGRAGRMGREGVAYTFVSPEEGTQLTRIEVRVNQLLQRAEMPGFSAFAKPQPTEAAPVKAKPVFGRRGRRVRRAL